MLERLHRVCVSEVSEAEQRRSEARASEAPFRLGEVSFSWAEVSCARDVAAWARLDGPDYVTGSEDHAVLRWFDASGRPVLFVD